MPTKYNPINDYKIYHMTTKKWGIHCMHIRMPRFDAKTEKRTGLCKQRRRQDKREGYTTIV
jgi:hypothetical protein